jgi:putative hydrolase of the HAD superfamily
VSERDGGAIRGLLVDFGGVLTTNVFDAFRSFAAREGLEPDAVKRLFREDERALAALRRLERGEMAVPEFEREFGPLLGVSETDGLVDRLFAEMRPDEEMISAVRRARGAGIRTGLISNSWSPDHYEQDRLDELFDGVVISAQVGLNKPEPEIFLLGAERIGVQPDACVFVDDLKENCAGAEAVGMTAILHRGAAETVPELERLLGVALAA